jgi:hypothetical protein
MFRMTNHNRRPVTMFALLCMTAALASAADDRGGQAPLFLTATNGANNYLAVINTKTREVDYVATGGSGGASGNAGGVAVAGRLAAVVNFGTSNVTIFTRTGNTMKPTQTFKTASQPVSVAFGHNHLVVLGLTTAESFPVFGDSVGTTADGTVPLLRSDKTAAQVVTFDGGVVYSEKSGSVAELDLGTNGVASGITGPNRAVALPDAPNNDTPFGMIGRGGNVYLTIAHSNLEALIVNGKIAATAGGPTPFKDAAGNLLHAPCWNALHGQFLYSSDSPGKQILRYLVSDSSIFFDKSAAPLGGSPSDLAADGNLLGVIDGGSSNVADVSLFGIDSEGELTLSFTVKIAAPITGAAFVR